MGDDPCAQTLADAGPGPAGLAMAEIERISENETEGVA